jgi:predicted ATPase
MDDRDTTRADQMFCFGPFRLSVAGRLLEKTDEPVRLGSRALDVLITLVERAGEVVSRDELVSRVWPATTVAEANLRVHVASLRKALGEGRSGPRYIVNIPGRGYSFVAPVERPGRRGAPTGAAVRTVRTPTLPARTPRMIGRDETVTAVCARVASRRFVSIVGPGGIGKTTVAVAAAHAMAADFDAAIAFVDLSVVEDGALVVPAVASAVGCLGHTQDSLPRLAAFLADKRILLVLDSCEHVIEAVAVLAERLFRDAPRAAIIVTTRETLRVEGESVHRLRPLDGPPRDIMPTADAALATPAVRLFMDRAADAGYPHDLSDKEAPLVVDICRQLDGIPLAIELAASRASAYGIAGLARLIGDRLMLLWQGRRSVSRHQTLRATLDWSYDVLSDREKAILCALSVFVGPFTLEAAHAVMAEPDVANQIAGQIASLVDKSLVSVVQTEGLGLFRLLDTTRAYAAVKLAERGEEDAVARRHARHYAQDLAGLRTGILQERELSAYARQIGDIRAALEWSFSSAGDASVGVELGAGAVPLFVGLSMLSECQRWCRQTIQALGEDQRGTRLELALQLPLAICSTYVHGNGDEARQALERGLELAEALGDTEYQLHCLAGLNLFRTRLAEFGDAVAVAERYAAVAERVAGAPQVVTAEWMLGASLHLVGDQAAAQHNYETGFACAAANGISQVHYFGYDHQVRALIGYARTLWLRGFPDLAAHWAHEGIDVAERQEHPVTLCICLLYAVPVFLWRGDQQIAEDLIGRLIACAERYSLAPYHAGGVGRRGELMLARGETAAGVAALRTALSDLRAERQYILSSAFSRALAEGLARSGQPAEAATIIDALVADATRSAGMYELPDMLRIQAEVQLAAAPDDWPAAEASLLASLDQARRQSALGWELRSALALCRLWADHGRAGDARRLLAGIHARFTEGFETLDLSEAQRWMRELSAAATHR